MARLTAVALVLVLACATRASALSQEEVQRELVKNSAVQKVVEMMNDMMAKGKTEKQEEKIRFAAFKQFCTSTSAEKATAIKDGEEKAEQLTADIAEAGDEIAQLAKEIQQHEADIGQASTEKAAATAAREKEHADFEAVHKDYTESISAVERAEEKIKAESAGELSLAQQKASLHSWSEHYDVPEAAKKAIQSYLLQEDDGDELTQSLQAPEAAAFESQSGGILDMVGKMGEKFEDKLTDVEKQEMNKNAAFNMLAADLVDTIESATNQKDKKTSRKANLEEEKAANEGDLAQTNSMVTEDTKYLADLDLECRQKSVDFEKRQDMRQGELDAINKAIEIMTSGAVSGGSSHLDLHQKAASLAQLRSAAFSPLQANVAAFLTDRATKSESRLLSLIATRVESDPFGKVTKMVKDMIQKLMEEANEEAEHKGFCDTEMTTNKQTRDAKTEESAELQATIDKTTADIQQLADEIATLGKEIAEIDGAMEKATGEREAEKSKNQLTISDSKAAQQATQQAMAVLKDFYAAMGEAAAAPREPLEAEGAIKYDLRALTILKKAGGGAFVQQGAKPGNATQAKAANATVAHGQDKASKAPVAAPAKTQAKAPVAAPTKAEPKAPVAAPAKVQPKVAGTAFLQVAAVKAKVPGAPEMEEGAYTGMGEGGIVGLLEVIESDFSKLIADTTSAESEAAQEFSTFTNDSAEDKAVKETDSKNKAGSKTRKEGDLLSAQKDLKTTKMELEAAMDYFEKLKPSCVEQGISYEERVAKRKEEIESLKEALEILSQGTP